MLETLHKSVSVLLKVKSYLETSFSRHFDLTSTGASNNSTMAAFHLGVPMPGLASCLTDLPAQLDRPELSIIL